ncbi:Hsp33 family molecular chaperone HslO [Novosphingobium sp. JCM 18896]|uniref:Hsp33 family molecular chaperone HslO n=1 Tax=Novosphingobium sp. JCM 18896 TaxID=2989731 RepID=UPI002223BC55|nr:Hsp33 family molecular chaperone HslO [Novosphingobium sp. JCM 18896]MCW1429139.1 Hsp33 family molecular chaperone HslO [Novosphingobium sp. JCM 18896]
MTQEASIPEGETGFDRVLAFGLPQRNARGRAVRLGPVLDEILSAHEYPTAIRHLLAEALVLTALMGSLLKDDEGQLTIQAQAQDETGTGIVDLLVCDWRACEVRGYVNFDAERLAALETFPTMTALFGSGGYLALTFDLASTKQRYQGIVPLEGDSLAEACQSYFAQSEQIPTLIRTAVRWDGHCCVAGGLLVQHLPDGEEGRERLHVRLDHPEWEHVAALAGSTRQEELVDPALSLEALVWRLFHEEDEVRVEQLSPLSRGCRCSVEHYEKVLSRFSDDARQEMRGDDGMISVDCAFCSRIFKIA